MSPDLQVTHQGSEGNCCGPGKGRTTASCGYALLCDWKAAQSDCSLPTSGPWHVGTRVRVRGARNALLTASLPPAVLRNSGLQAGPTSWALTGSQRSGGLGPGHSAWMHAS